MKELLTETLSFRQLLDMAGTNIPYVLEPGSNRRRRSKTVRPRSLLVRAVENSEAWTFAYKSNPSRTGNRWHGYIQFLKPGGISAADEKSADEYDCKVDCDCPDYRYRFAYNNASAGAGILGDPRSKTGWRFHNKNIGTPPRPVSQGGVGDYGPGLCKHLCALGKYLETKFTSKAPTPDDSPPKPEKKRVPFKKSQDYDNYTSKAPSPEDKYDTYTSSESDILEESFSAGKLSKFVQENPEFEIYYDTPNEILNEFRSIFESHEQGEWWIDGTGEVEYADGDIGDSNHESAVISYLSHEILSYFGIEVDEAGYLDEYIEKIRQSLLSSNRLSQKDLTRWYENKKNIPLIIIEKLIEDRVYNTPEQTKEAVSIAFGNSSIGGRNYAMKYLRWKIMVTTQEDIMIQTWFLKMEDLVTVVRGIWEIMVEDDPDDDPDSVVGKDGYTGPRITITVQSSGKIFKNIPLAVLEEKMPQLLHNYQSGVYVGDTENINEEFTYLHKEYSLYEGINYILVIFKDNSRLKFEVHFRNNRGEDKDRWKHKALTTWKSCATEIHKESGGYSKGGNWKEKSWRRCFKEALKHPRMKEFIRTNPEYRIFG